MQNSELRAWMALHRSPQISAGALRRIARYVPEPQALFGLSKANLAALKISPEAQQAAKKAVDSAQVEQDLKQIQSLAISVIPLNDERYPLLLSQISDPPALLYVRGNPELLNHPQLAMVGSRRSSRQGKDNAFRFARAFANNGFAVCSGLALGIDAECHRGALADNGNTVAVVGTGVDIVYPAANRRLFEQVLQHGAIVSEFPLGTQPRPSLFPQRNRMISGLSLGVLVVEAALRSGSLITARCALEQGREVFAIPSSIHNTSSHGCHALIKQGAKLVETSADVLEELEGWLLPGNVKPAADEHSDTASAEQLSVSPREQQLIDLLGFDPAPIDLLQQQSGWSLAELASVLTTLELKGLVENMAGCYQRLA
jgi:DNA processing protein